jgi:hypothetical protein
LYDFSREASHSSIGADVRHRSQRIILASCSTTETRISGHPEIYQSLSPRDQALMSQGQIRDGMSPNAVYLAWGSSDRKIVGNMRGRPTETWVYVHYTTYSYPYPYPMVPVMGSD